MPSRNLFPTRLALALLLGLAAVGAAAADEAGRFWQVLREPRTHLLMRHATAPGVGDPPGFQLADCATQRNLSAEGRAEAGRIGRAIADHGPPVALVLSSAWCRALDTAKGLDLAPVSVEPALNSVFENGAAAAAQNRMLLARLAALDRQAQRAVLVTHQVNITALTGIVPRSGEMLVVRLDAAGELEVLGRLAGP